MRRIILIFIAGLLFASCAPQPAFMAEPTITASPTIAPVHAPEIRFALIGQPRDINAWQLFDKTGASYADYALRFEYWPRLYHIALPGFDFQPLAADGMPSVVTQNGNTYSAIVKLRSDLMWTDGVPFTAEDVVFTVNTSLKYELGYDWASYYPIDYLDHVEAIDPLAVKFYFKQNPNVGVWQYGALQGPVLQKAFWETRISESSALLPDEKITADIEYATGYLATVQSRVDELSTQVNTLFLNGQENRELSGELIKRQGELGYARNTLNELLEERTARIESAHQALYAVNDAGEPTLGTWIPAGQKDNVWINDANPDFPFVQPNFDHAVYLIYPDEESAYSSFLNNEVDVILSPAGVGLRPLTVISGTSSSRFLVFNSGHTILSDVNVREALACMIDLGEIDLLQAEFVSGVFWTNSDLSLPCTGFSRAKRIESAVGFLKEAGYTWVQQPNASQSGSGMKLPDNTDFPRITLLSTLPNADSDRAVVAGYIEQQALHLGIPMEVQLTDLATLQYAVYSSKKYDMAVFGWRLSEYPGYLCEWFQAGAQFENNLAGGSSRLKSVCETLAVESDLEAARSQVFNIQAILMEDLPFIPLYTGAAYDAFQNVQYPLMDVGGISALYGAPSYAWPVP